MNLISSEYFTQTDTLALARQLLGKILVTQFNEIETSGRIVETEAYIGPADRASHAYGGRRTKRTEVMFHKGGHAYVYLCYGIHHLFNIVTHQQDVPHAILIRALDPLSGIDHMLLRRKKTKLDNSLTRGPGSLSQAMGIHTGHSGRRLTPPGIFIMDDHTRYKQDDIGIGPRIGVDYAGADAALPYRFFIKENRFVSGK